MIAKQNKSASQTIKIAFFILLAFLFIGCVTQKRCNKKFPPETKTEIKIVEKEIIRDTTIYVYLQADTVFQKDTITVYETPSGYQTVLSRIDLNYSYSTAQVINGRLDHKLFQKETLIEQTIKNAIKENSTHTVEKIETVREVVYASKWHKFTSRFTLVAFAIIIIFIVWKLK
jgi:hypothetical protein